MEDTIKYYGKVFKSDSNDIVVDAEPHVMKKVRDMFPFAKTHPFGGQFTHRPLYFVNNLTTLKDIEWLCMRYPLEMDSSLSDEIKKGAKAYDDLAKGVVSTLQNAKYSPPVDSWVSKVTPRDYQTKFYNFLRDSGIKRTLLADRMGLGKTLSALLITAHAENRKCIFVCKPHLRLQHKEEILRYFPDAKVCILMGKKATVLPDADYYIISYTGLASYSHLMMDLNFVYNTVIFDEVSELRRMDTEKRKAARLLSERAQYVIGADGTPLWNYGEEMWSIMDVIHPGIMGEKEDFKYEWCDYGGRVVEPAILNNYLSSRGLLVRRTPESVGIKLGDVPKHVYTLQSDEKELSNHRDVLKKLAISLLKSRVGAEEDPVSMQFDTAMRLMTGLSKARPVAEFIKQIVEEEGQVILAGWHHEVYDIWKKELAQYNPVFFHGKITPEQKDKAVKAFISGESKIFIISLRSGQGLNGLQYVCNNVVFGELDWAPAAMDQIIGRIDRPGQTRPVNAFYLKLNDGADPIIMERINIKRSQHHGIVEGKENEANFLSTSDKTEIAEKMKAVARRFLESIGEEVPVAVEEKGLLGRISNVLKSISVSSGDEDSMQRSVYDILKDQLPDCRVEREFIISPKSRLDFFVTDGHEHIVIECKINQKKKVEVYKQIRRYIEEITPDAVILFTPWGTVSDFVIDDTPVLVINYTENSI